MAGDLFMKNKKVFILGMARSGYEAAKILAKDNEVIVNDRDEQDVDQVKELESLGVKVIIGGNPVDLFDDSFDLMVKNPGIKYDHPAVVKAHELGMDVINEVELAYKYMAKGVNIIGVTGSNGKTTTVTLIYNILKEAGFPVYLGGNIGTPLCHFVKDLKSGDYLVMEISDHQLCDMYDFKTNVSLLNNIFEVHTDFHDSHEKYKMTKKKIFNNHTKDDIAIINYDNEEAMEVSKDIPSTKYYFSKNSKQNVYLLNNAIYYKDEKVIDCKDIKLKGIHNYENIMGVISVVKLYDVDNKYIFKILNTFSGVEHRIEYVDTIDGVMYYNDSKATNCESTKIALRSFKEPTLLLLGGLDRGHSFDDLTDDMKNVKYVACYGETKDRIKDYCNRINVECDIFDNLVEATKACHEKAVSGDVVLLSPACASWDQYKAFEDRGNEFKDTVKSFK
jgi:UDP-N-acetylmuramoylalanine--D-glutamate ligase